VAEIVLRHKSERHERTRGVETERENRQMASASRVKLLNTFYINSLKLIGSRGHVTVHAQKRLKLDRHRPCRSLYSSTLLGGAE
jgi:hypothetical protein